MASPRHIPSAQSVGQGLRGSMSLEGSSYESTRTDLSLESSNVIIEGQWIVLGRIGEGSFGEVFEVRDLDTDRHYAIKRERLKVRQPQLGHENLIYDALAGGVGIPQCHWHGQYDGFDCLVMDLLGPSINQLRGSVADMSLDIVVDLGCQMVSILEHVHHRGVLYRDVKPENFLFGPKSFLPEAEMVESMDASGMTTVDYKKPTCRQVFDTLWPDKSCMKLWLVDFGLATFWRDPDTGKLTQNNKHIRHKIGTARYASINVHRGRAHSRRDDLESITYIVLDLLLGTLPWTGIQAKNSKAGWERMKQLKVDTYMSDLCAGLPEGILQFVEYPRGLQFNDEPDYTKMRAFLQGSLPGGPYAQPVRSPFGGKTVSADSYAPKDDQNAAMHIRHPPATLHATSGMDQHHIMQPFSMDEELAHQLRHAANIVGNDAITSTPASSMQPNSQNTQNTEKQQKKHESSSSYKELLRRNKPKKVGWNTYKHDDEPWNPQADWMRGDSDATSRSWGDTPAAGHATTDASSSWGAVTPWGTKDEQPVERFEDAPTWGGVTPWGTQDQPVPPQTQQQQQQPQYWIDVHDAPNWMTSEPPSWQQHAPPPSSHQHHQWQTPVPRNNNPNSQQKNNQHHQQQHQRHRRGSSRGRGAGRGTRGKQLQQQHSQQQQHQNQHHHRGRISANQWPNQDDTGTAPHQQHPPRS